VELPGFGQEQAVPLDGVPGLVQEKHPVSFQKQVNLVFPRIMGMVAPMPGKFVSPHQPVDKDRILDPHIEKYQ
jgi:hypothetical protein